MHAHPGVAAQWGDSLRSFIFQLFSFTKYTLSGVFNLSLRVIIFVKQVASLVLPAPLLPPIFPFSCI